MATKEVITSECDSCGATEQHPTNKKAKTTLPVKWIHVDGFNHRGVEVFSLDLCPKCSKVALTIESEGTNAAE